MPIQNNDQLATAVAEASRLVQEIHDYTKRELREDAKMKFPRGLIKSAEENRNLCPSYLDDRQKSSCAYGFMYMDVLWWISSRTDIGFVAKEMVIKSGIITVGTILEAVLTIPGNGIFDANSNAGVKRKLIRARELGWIEEADEEALKALWDRRNNVHLRLLDSHEFNKYRVEHLNVPAAALARFMANLKEIHA